MKQLFVNQVGRTTFEVDSEDSSGDALGIFTNLFLRVELLDGPFVVLSHTEKNARKNPTYRLPYMPCADNETPKETLYRMLRSYIGYTVEGKRQAWTPLKLVVGGPEFTLLTDEGIKTFKSPVHESEYSLDFSFMGLLELKLTSEQLQFICGGQGVVLELLRLQDMAQAIDSHLMGKKSIIKIEPASLSLAQTYIALGLKLAGQDEANNKPDPAGGDDASTPGDIGG